MVQRGPGTSLQGKVFWCTFPVMLTPTNAKTLTAEHGVIGAWPDVIGII